MKKNRDSVPPIQQTNFRKKNRDSVPPIQQLGQPLMTGGPFGMGGGTVGVGSEPIDFVRSTQYDTAMAAQRYDQMLADMVARAQAGQFDVRRDEVGSISNRNILQQESDFYANNLNQNIVNQAKQEYLASLPSGRRYAQALTPTRYGGTFGDRRGSGFDKWFAENYINKGLIQVPTYQRDSIGALPRPRPSGPDFIDSRDPNKQYLADMVNYYDPATGEVTSRTRGVVPGPGSRFVRYDGPSPQGPGGDMSGYIPGYVPPQQGGQRPTQASQQPGYGIPQGPQTPQNSMATYNNLLQQGIQRSNTMNQDAATNFANLQAGAPTTQPASPAKANPVVPIAGMGVQPKATPAPRKFSTVNTPSARFF